MLKWIPVRLFVPLGQKSEDFLQGNLTDFRYLVLLRVNFSSFYHLQELLWVSDPLTWIDLIPLCNEQLMKLAPLVKNISEPIFVPSALLPILRHSACWTAFAYDHISIFKRDLYKLLSRVRTLVYCGWSVLIIPGAFVNRVLVTLALLSYL